MSENIDEINKVDLMNINPEKAFRKMAPPIAIFMLFNAVCNFINLVWAKFIGVAAVATIAVNGPLFMAVVLTGSAVGLGVNSFMSRELGKKHRPVDTTTEDYKKIEKKASNILLHGIIICGIISIISCIVGLMMIIRYIQFDDMACNYLAPLFIFGFISIFSQFFPQTLQAEGETKKPNIYLAIGLILHIILAPILGLKLGLGLRGFAISTIITTAVPFILCIRLYIKDDYFTNIQPKNFKFMAGILKELAIVSIPMYITNSLGAIPMKYSEGIINAVGGNIALTTGAFTREARAIVLAPSEGISGPMSSIGGHLYGADNYKELKSHYFFVIKKAVLLGGICSIILIFITRFLLGSALPVFNYLNLEMTILLIIISFITPIAYVTKNILIGIGSSIYVLILTLLSVGLIILFSKLLIPILNTMYAVLLSLGASDCIISIIGVLLVLYLIKKEEKKILE
ncbi:MAG: MATE family efflux transporter [Methanobacteriaceae archaeon]|nr:MATE family efflux transporter [Methanobacteriaceae archaeon]